MQSLLKVEAVEGRKRPCGAVGKRGKPLYSKNTKMTHLYLLATAGRILLSS